MINDYEQAEGPMTKRLILLAMIFVTFPPAFSVPAQDPARDDTTRADWPAAFKDVEIPSTADGKIQKAYFYATRDNKPQPLIVSLHTWSGNYRQQDGLIREVLSRDMNYIRPDYRGPNLTREACGSPLVASDIDDAIAYAVQNGNVDPNHIHILGGSGGGHAALIAYMRSRHNVRSFSAWVPISDLPKWYYESLGRQTQYAGHIAMATTGDESRIDLREARKRSPLYMDTPVELRKDSKLYLYAGIHDGYSGSVPITHSLEMYNKVVRDFNPVATEEIIPDHVIARMVVARYLPGDDRPEIAGRAIHYRKQFEDKVRIVIFEGGHEMLVEAALAHVPDTTQQSTSGRTD